VIAPLRAGFLLFLVLSSGAAADEELQGYVRVSDDAPMFSRPDPNARVSRVRPPEDRGRMDPGGLTLAVVADHGEFVEVHSTHEYSVWPVPFCSGPSQSWSLSLDVPFFLRRTDLVPVLAKPAERTFADGTRVLFGAGTPVRVEEGRAHVALPHLAFELPDAEVARSFRTPGVGPLPPLERQAYVHDETPTAQVGELIFRLGEVGALLGKPARIRIDGGPPLALFRTGCLEMEVHLDRALEPNRSPEKFGLLLLVGGAPPLSLFRGERPRFGVRRKTAIYWPDGRRAGSVREDYDYYKDKPSTIVGNLRCFRENEDGLTFCYRKADVRRPSSR
jgi:hypothetical protein